MKKYLILEFENAGLFRINGKDNSTDIVSTIDGHFARKGNHKFFEEPITKYQIHNVIQVLVGERPKPSLRRSLHPNREDLMPVAEDSFLKLDESNVYYGSKGNRKIRREIIHARKANWKATSPNNNISYHTFEIYCGEECFNYLINISKLELGITSFKKLKEKYTMMSLLKKLREVYFSNSKEGIRNDLSKLENKDFKVFKPKTTFENLFKKLVLDFKRKQIFNFLNNENIEKELKELVNSMNVSNQCKLNISRGISYVENYNGVIYIPLSDEDIEKVRNGKGCATILDGGLVKIKGLLKKRDLDFEGFKRVGDINCDIKCG